MVHHCCLLSRSTDACRRAFLHGPAASATTATATRSRWSRVSHVWCDVCSLSPDVAQFYPSLQRSALSTPPTLPRPQRFFCALRALRLPDLRHPGLFSSCARVSELSPCPTSQDVSILVCFLMRPISPCDVFYVLSNDGVSRVSLRSEMIKTLASHIWWSDGAEAPRWDGADRLWWCTCRRPQRTLLQRLLGGEARTASSRFSSRHSVRDTFPLPTRPRSDGRNTCGSLRRGSRKSGLDVKWTVVHARSAHEEHEATGLSTKEAAAEAAASLTAALDCWQAAEKSRRRVVEARKKSAEVLHKAQRELDEVLHNLLQSVEDFDMQVQSITVRKESLGADEWFRDFRQAMKRVIAGIAE